LHSIRPRKPRTGRQRQLIVSLAVLSVCLLSVSSACSGIAEENDKATRALLCDCGCSPQSVHDCACGRASEMKNEIAAKIRGGMSGQQVLDEAVAKRGEKVLISPTATGFNLFAWLGPGAALLLGIASVVLVLRRWRPDPKANVPAPRQRSPSDDEYLARLEREIREHR